MNKQIKELAEQAGLKVESWMTNPPKPFQILGSTEQFDKFAELPVKECVHVVLDKDGKEWAGYVHVCREESADMIKKHFGVEE